MSSERKNSKGGSDSIKASPPLPNSDSNIQSGGFTPLGSRNVSDQSFTVAYSNHSVQNSVVSNMPILPAIPVQLPTFPSGQSHGQVVFMHPVGSSGVFPSPSHHIHGDVDSGQMAYPTFSMPYSVPMGIPVQMPIQMGIHAPSIPQRPPRPQTSNRSRGSASNESDMDPSLAQALLPPLPSEPHPSASTSKNTPNSSGLAGGFKKGFLRKNSTESRPASTASTPKSENINVLASPKILESNIHFEELKDSSEELLKQFNLKATFLVGFSESSFSRIGSGSVTIDCGSLLENLEPNDFSSLLNCYDYYLAVQESPLDSAVVLPEENFTNILLDLPGDAPISHPQLNLTAADIAAVEPSPMVDRDIRPSIMSTLSVLSSSSLSQQMSKLKSSNQAQSGFSRCYKLVSNIIRSSTKSELNSTSSSGSTNLLLSLRSSPIFVSAQALNFVLIAVSRDYTFLKTSLGDKYRFSTHSPSSIYLMGLVKSNSPVCPPLAISEINFSKVWKSSMRVIWSVPTLRGDPITSYEVQISGLPIAEGTPSIPEETFQSYLRELKNSHSISYSNNDPEPLEWHSILISESVHNYLDVKHLTPGAWYAVRVRSFSNTGPSDWSEVYAARTVPTAPSSPEKLEITNGKYGNLILKWSDPISIGGALITEFELEGAEGVPSAEYIAWLSHREGPAPSHNLMFSTIYRGPSNSFSQSVRPLEMYSFRVSASNEIGKSPPSTIVSFRSGGIPPSLMDPPEVSSLHYVSGLNATQKPIGLSYRDASVPSGQVASSSDILLGDVLSELVNSIPGTIAVPYGPVTMSWDQAIYPSVKNSAAIDELLSKTRYSLELVRAKARKLPPLPTTSPPKSVKGKDIINAKQQQRQQQPLKEWAPSGSSTLLDVGSENRFTVPVSHLEPGTVYLCRVSATGEYGAGEPSNWVAVAVAPAAPPSINLGAAKSLVTASILKDDQFTTIQTFPRVPDPSLTPLPNIVNVNDISVGSGSDVLDLRRKDSESKNSVKSGQKSQLPAHPKDALTVGAFSITTPPGSPPSNPRVGQNPPGIKLHNSSSVNKKASTVAPVAPSHNYQSLASVSLAFPLPSLKGSSSRTKAVIVEAMHEPDLSKPVFSVPPLPDFRVPSFSPPARSVPTPARIPGRDYVFDGSVLAVAEGPSCPTSPSRPSSMRAARSSDLEAAEGCSGPLGSSSPAWTVWKDSDVFGRLAREFDSAQKPFDSLTQTSEPIISPQQSILCLPVSLSFLTQEDFEVLLDGQFFVANHRSVFLKGENDLLLEVGKSVEEAAQADFHALAALVATDNVPLERVIVKCVLRQGGLFVETSAAHVRRRFREQDLIAFPLDTGDRALGIVSRVTDAGYVVRLAGTTESVWKKQKSKEGMLADGEIALEPSQAFPPESASGVIADHQRLQLQKKEERLKEKEKKKEKKDDARSIVESGELLSQVSEELALEPQVTQEESMFVPPSWPSSTIQLHAESPSVIGECSSNSNMRSSSQFVRIARIPVVHGTTEVSIVTPNCLLPGHHYQLRVLLETDVGLSEPSVPFFVTASPGVPCMPGPLFPVSDNTEKVDLDESSSSLDITDRTWNSVFLLDCNSVSIDIPIPLDCGGLEPSSVMLIAREPRGYSSSNNNNKKDFKGTRMKSFSLSSTASASSSATESSFTHLDPTCGIFGDTLTATSNNTDCTFSPMSSWNVLGCLSVPVGTTPSLALKSYGVESRHQQLVISSLGSSSWKVQNYPISAISRVSVPANMLKPGRTYVLQASFQNSVGIGPWSPPLVVRTRAGPPSVVTGLSCSSLAPLEALSALISPATALNTVDTTSFGSSLSLARATSSGSQGSSRMALAVIDPIVTLTKLGVPRELQDAFVVASKHSWLDPKAKSAAFVNWNAPNDVCGAPVLGYEVSVSVSRSQGSSASALLINPYHFDVSSTADVTAGDMNLRTDLAGIRTLPASGSSHGNPVYHALTPLAGLAIVGLPASSKLSVRVRALSHLGASPWSHLSRLSMPADLPEAPPALLLSDGVSEYARCRGASLAPVVSMLARHFVLVDPLDLDTSGDRLDHSSPGFFAMSSPARTPVSSIVRDSHGNLQPLILNSNSSSNFQAISTTSNSNNNNEIAATASSFGALAAPAISLAFAGRKPSVNSTLSQGSSLSSISYNMSSFHSPSASASIHTAVISPSLWDPLRGSALLCLRVICVRTLSPNSAASGNHSHSFESMSEQELDALAAARSSKQTDRIIVAHLDDIPAPLRPPFQDGSLPKIVEEYLVQPEVLRQMYYQPEKNMLIPRAPGTGFVHSFRCQFVTSTGSSEFSPWLHVYQPPEHLSGHLATLPAPETPTHSLQSEKSPNVVSGLRDFKDSIERGKGKTAHLHTIPSISSSIEEVLLKNAKMGLASGSTALEEQIDETHETEASSAHENPTVSTASSTDVDSVSTSRLPLKQKGRSKARKRATSPLSSSSTTTVTHIEDSQLYLKPSLLNRATEIASNATERIFLAFVDMIAVFLYYFNNLFPSPTKNGTNTSSSLKKRDKKK